MTGWTRALFGIPAGLGLAGCGGEDTAPATEPHAKELAAIRAELTELAEKEHLPGIAYGVVVDGKLAGSGAIGVRSTKTGEPLTADMVMPTGSIAVKTLVAAETVRLHQDGKLSLDAPVKSVLPWLTLPAGSEGVTFQQGFTMLSGLFTPLRDACADPSLKGVLASQTSFAPPGHVWVYSATGFTFAALAIEELTKKSFESALTERFLEPMGMTTATFDASVAMQGEHSATHLLENGEATAYELDGLPECKPGVDCSVCEEFRANAGLYLSANHLGLMLEHVLAKSSPLDAALLDEMAERSDGKWGWGGSAEYGYGVSSNQYGDQRVFLAETAWAGVEGAMAWIPGAGLGVVFVANAMTGTLPTSDQAVEMLRHFVDLPDPAPATTPPSTWQKYTGKYAGTIAAAPYEVTLSGSELRISNPLWSPPDPVTMTQDGGDHFHYLDPTLDAVRYVAFFPGDGDGTQMQYMFAQSPWLLAKRVMQ